MRNELAGIYLAMGAYEEVIETCEASLNLSITGLAMPQTATPLGDAYCQAGQLEKGIDLLERSKAYAKRVGRGPIVECEYSLPLASGYLAKGDVDSALTNVEEGLQIAVKQGYRLHEARAYRILGDIHAPTDFATAEDYFTKSLTLMRTIKAKNEEGKTELSWGRAHKQHGNIEGARMHLTRAAEIFEALETTRYLEWTRGDLAELSP